MKQFDFNLAIKSGQNPKKIEWYKENKSKKITEEEFIKVMQEVFKPQTKGNTHYYSPSKLKKQYRNLRTNFGFFK